MPTQPAPSVAVFASAAKAFAELVAALPPSGWDGPGLGEWDLRALVGHTSRALITVSTYLQSPADHQDVADPAHYYAQVRGYAANNPDIVERGRTAGRDLGSDPVAKINGLVETVLAELNHAGDPLISVIGGLGIRLSDYLSTRVFELVVHSLDISRATGIAAALPAEAVESAMVLAAQIAAQTGQAESALPALTGRGPLPNGFSVL